MVIYLFFRRKYPHFYLPSPLVEAQIILRYSAPRTLSSAIFFGDADDDGSVSGSNLLAVTNNFGAAATLTAANAAVPEPPGIAVLLGLCLAAASMRQPANRGC